MRYAVVIEKDETGFGAYVPDLPGCVAVVKLVTRSYSSFHIEGLKKDGEPVPEPTSSIEFIDVAA